PLRAIDPTNCCPKPLHWGKQNRSIQLSQYSLIATQGCGLFTKIGSPTSHFVATPFRPDHRLINLVAALIAKHPFRTEQIHRESFVTIWSGKACTATRK